MVAQLFLAALPYLGAILFMGLGYIALQMIGIRAPKKKKKVPALREDLTVHEFAELARTYGAGAQVAREMYRLLEPSYNATLRSTLTRSFTADLGVTAASVEQMFLTLVERCGGIIRSSYPVSELDTPATMMPAAERTVERAALERRAAMRTVQLPGEDRGRSVVPVAAQRRR